MEVNILDLCESGNLNEVKKCLDEGVSPNFQNNEGESLLQVAAANGYLDLATLLLNNGASVDLSNNYGWTPLMHAAKYGHVLVVAHLIKAKAKVNITNKLGVSAVVAAACSGSLSIVKLLIEAGAMVQHMSAGNETNECDLSALMAVSFFGYNDILNYLVQNGGEVNHSSAVTGLTPLMLAACSGNKRTVTSLVENGADLNAMDLCGRTAVDYSHVFNQNEIKIYLESLISPRSKSFSSKNDVFQIIKDGDVLKLKSILERDRQFLNIRLSPNGITPLMLASMFGLLDITNLFICSGAPLNVQDTENSWTALMHAVVKGHREVVQLLLDAGADAYICAKNGCTALDLAHHKDCNNPAITELLKSKFAQRELKSALLTSEATNRGRLSAAEKLPAKRSTSQTRVKEWIGGMAQHLQNKMLTLRSPKCSENIPNILDTAHTDESSSEVFLEQTSPPEELEKENSSNSDMLPPHLYLAKELKEHKVEAITPPFPPMMTDYMVSPTENKKIYPPGKTQKPQRNSLRVPNLLKNYTQKKPFVKFSMETIDKTLVYHERSNCKKIEACAIPSKLSLNLNLSSTNKLEQTKSTSGSCKLSPGDLTMLLSEESLQKYVETFRNQEIDMETFLHLTQADLHEIGIENTDSQKKLLDIIKKFHISE